MNTNDQQYRESDLTFYRERIAPLLPPAVLDFHAHTWLHAHWKHVPWDKPGGKYMVAAEDFPFEELLDAGARLFPDCPYHAVCFGYPTPAADLERTNAYVLAAGGHPGMYPLLVVGKGTMPAAALERAILDGPVYGIKVFLNWQGDDYGEIAIPDMIGPMEMALADRYGLVVLLHVPRAGRLTDPVVQRGVRDYALRYPNARLVLAHCGRCYLPDEMQQAVGAVADLENVYLDTAMVMDPTVLQIVFEHLPASRVLFATDLPVAAMRGRRVYVMDHWVDVVLEGYPPSAYRVASGGIRATYMVYEIILAIRRAAERAGLSTAETEGIFFDNGMRLLSRVKRH